jgi:hypothetical protein
VTTAATVLALFLAGGPGGSPGVVRGAVPGVVDSSQIREDPEASKRDWAWLEAHEAREEFERHLRWDREHMKQHRAVLAAIAQARSRYHRVRTKRALETTHDLVRTAAPNIRRQVHDIDPWRNGSYVLDDYEAMLQILEKRYPAAVRARLEGKEADLADVRKELDSRVEKVRRWLAKAAAHDDDE